MVKILATICSVATGQCHEEAITNSQVEIIGIAGCAVGIPAVADWLTRNRPGFSLHAWRCEIGAREKRGA
jgi:hypothetical protein